MTEEKPDHQPQPVWGILVSSGENDIDITISPSASQILKASSAIFVILFLFTMWLSVHLCSSSAEKDNFAGVLRAKELVELRLPESNSTQSAIIEEVLVTEGMVVAKDQVLIRFRSDLSSGSIFCSPINGILEEVIVAKGREVRSGAVVCRVAGTSSFSFSGKASEILLDKLSPGKPCRILFYAYPDRNFSGTIERVSGKGEYDANLGYSLFPVEVRVENPDNVLRIGMSGSSYF